VAVLSGEEGATRVFLNVMGRVSIISYENDEESGHLRESGAIDIQPSDVRALIAALRPFAAK
jgi:hypothetical protein